MVLAEAAATVAVLGVSLVLHCRVQPYAHRHQNVAEAVLASCSIVAVLIGSAIFTARAKLSAASSIALEMSYMAMLLGPALIFVVWATLGMPTASSTRERLLTGDSEQGSGAEAAPTLAPHGGMSINREP